MQMMTKLAALVAAGLLACTPAGAQKLSMLPAAAPLSGSEAIPAAQGAGCATQSSPCGTVATTPAQLAAYLAPTFEAKDADLDAIAALTTTAFGRSLLTMPDAPTTRASLGLGSLATQSGTFSGSSSGTNTGDQTSVSGNAGTATKLLTARAINGVNFDGSGAITINAVDATPRAALAGATFTGEVAFGAGEATKVVGSNAYSAFYLNDGVTRAGYIQGGSGGLNIVNGGGTLTLSGASGALNMDGTTFNIAGGALTIYTSGYALGVLYIADGIMKPVRDNTLALGTASQRYTTGYLLHLNLSGLSTYASDSAAGSGGAVRGDLYQTSTGVLMIKQ